LNSKTIRRLYTDLLYIDYSRQYTVGEIADYPEYIARETGTGYTASVIRKLIADGRIEISESGRYCATEAGICFLKEHEDYIAFFEFACPYVTVEAFASEREKLGSAAGFRKVMESLLKQRAGEARKNKEYVVLKDLSVDIAALKEEENPQESLLYIICALLISMSGIEKLDIIEDYKAGRIRKKELLSQFKDYFFVDHILSVAIARLKDYLTEELVEQAEKMCSLPFNLCTRETAMMVLKALSAGIVNRLLWNDRFYKEFLTLTKINPEEGPDIDYDSELFEISFGADFDPDEEIEEDF